MTDFKALAEAALPQPTFPDPPHERDGRDDWGSQRQIDAQNAFTDAVGELLTPKEWAAYDHFCLKASTEEIVEEGLRLVATKTAAKA